MRNGEIKIVRYYKDSEKPSEDDVIAKYFWSDREKKFIYQSSWNYKTMIKRVEIVGLLQFVDELFNMIQDDDYGQPRKVVSLQKDFDKGEDFLYD